MNNILLVGVIAVMLSGCTTTQIVGTGAVVTGAAILANEEYDGQVYERQVYERQVYHKPAYKDLHQCYIGDHGVTFCR